MINLRSAPVVRILIPFAFGSLAGYKDFIEVEPLWLLVLSGSSWGAALLFYSFCLVGRQIFHLGFSISVLVLFFMTGIATGRIDRPNDPGIPVNKSVVLRGRLEDEPVLRNGKMVFRMDVMEVYTRDSVFLSRNLVKAYLELSSQSPPPKVGETWLLSGRLIQVKNAGNPGEVDYASILKRKNCWYNFYSDSTQAYGRLMEDSEPGIPGPVELRKTLSGYWEGAPETKALLKAVCLGDRSGLSAELRQSYSMAGGMHVLAVSGLHIGLIWWVLNRLLSFLVLTGKREILRIIIITFILWSFAYVTGFSSSVSRSVCMFTFYSLSKIINHRGHPVNAILVSMFLLILIHPGRLLDVGFQLSYAAVLSIVTINPILRGLWRPGNRLVRWVWEATGISLAAQIGTLPLVVLYFHQFPVYALLTNLVAVPLLSCIITIFVVSAPLALTGIGAGIASSLLMVAGGLMNDLIELIATIPGAVVEGLFLDRFTVVILMILIFMLILFLRRRDRVVLYFSVLLLCFQVVWSAQSRSSSLRTAETRISHFRGGSLISIREGVRVDHYILADDPGTIAHMDRYLSTVWGRRCFEESVIHIGDEESARLLIGGMSCALRIGSGTWMMGNAHICGLVVSALYEKARPEIPERVNPDFVLLSGGPSLFHSSFLSSCHILVADGSNNRWYTGKLQESGLNYYDTSKRGAFVIDH